MLLRLSPVNPVRIGTRRWRTFVAEFVEKWLVIAGRSPASAAVLAREGVRLSSVCSLPCGNSHQVSVIFGRRVGGTLSPEFGLVLFPKAPQAFPERLLYGLACYPEPALPPVGAEFFPVAGPRFSNRPLAPSRGVLSVNLKLGWRVGRQYGANRVSLLQAECRCPPIGLCRFLLLGAMLGAPVWTSIGENQAASQIASAFGPGEELRDTCPTEERSYQK